MKYLYLLCLAISLASCGQLEEESSHKFEDETDNIYFDIHSNYHTSQIFDHVRMQFYETHPQIHKWKYYFVEYEYGIKLVYFWENDSNQIKENNCIFFIPNSELKYLLNHEE